MVPTRTPHFHSRSHCQRLFYLQSHSCQRLFSFSVSLPTPLLLSVASLPTPLFILRCIANASFHFRLHHCRRLFSFSVPKPTPLFAFGTDTKCCCGVHNVGKLRKSVGAGGSVSHATCGVCVLEKYDGGLEQSNKSHSIFHRAVASFSFSSSTILVRACTLKFLSSSRESLTAAPCGSSRAVAFFFLRIREARCRDSQQHAEISPGLSLSRARFFAGPPCQKGAGGRHAGGRAEVRDPEPCWRGTAERGLRGRVGSEGASRYML